jgi:hypothetical protein
VTRIEAWAEEARRLTATELREYIAPRRHALLTCLLAQIRAGRLDDLVTMLIRFLGRIETRASRKYGGKSNPVLANRPLGSTSSR